MDNDHLRTGPPRIGDQRAEYAELIERLEKATGPDRQLDNAIEAAVDFPKPTNPDDLPGYPPYFTASIDAALTLLPKPMPVELHIGPRDMISEASVIEPVVSTDDQGRRVTNWRKHDALARHKNEPGFIRSQPAAIALCIAAMKARTP